MVLATSKSGKRLEVAAGSAGPKAAWPVHPLLGKGRKNSWHLQSSSCLGKLRTDPQPGVQGPARPSLHPRPGQRRIGKPGDRDVHGSCPCCPMAMSLTAGSSPFFAFRKASSCPTRNHVLRTLETCGSLWEGAVGPSPRASLGVPPRSSISEGRRRAVRRD